MQISLTGMAALEQVQYLAVIGQFWVGVKIWKCRALLANGSQEVLLANCQVFFFR